VRDAVLPCFLVTTISRNCAVTWDIRASPRAIYSLPPQILPLRQRKEARQAGEMKDLGEPQMKLRNHFSGRIAVPDCAPTKSWLSRRE